jgi:foldase protein PrsA
VSKLLRFIPALGAVLFAISGLAACGGGIPGNAVVSVGGTPITKTTFAHWMSVAASSSATSSTTGKAPVPEPPSYTACIARLQANQPKPAKGVTVPGPAQLKSECETQYKTLQTEVLGFLISSQWVIGEASSLGVKVSDKEVKKRFEQIKTQQFPKPAEFEKFLARSSNPSPT